MEEITQILKAIENGETEAAEQLFPLAYAELRRMAAAKLGREREGHTLQPTALVHEAYLRLSGPEGEVGQWNSRRHFFAAAAQAMRRILVDSVRQKLSQKRGAGAEHTVWDDEAFDLSISDDRLLAIDEALEKLEAEDEQLALLVKLRYFVGMTVEETASALGMAPRTVNRHWEFARVWLQSEISGEL